MQDLEEMNLTELKKIAKENNIKNISKLKKDELITILKQVLHSTTKNKINIEETNSEDIV